MVGARMRSGRSWRKSLGLCGVLAVSPALAQPPAPAPLRTNDYAIDLYQGPVLAGSRVVGLAGAFVAMADGIDGDTQNPASPAVRVPFSYTDVDFDLGAGLSFPGSLGRSGDFFNSGSRTKVVAGNNLYVFLNGAFNLQIDHWGFGVTADLQQYSLRRDEPSALLGEQGIELRTCFRLSEALRSSRRSHIGSKKGAQSESPD